MDEGRIVLQERMRKMIFNTSVLKKMMKTAYRGAGLLVANCNGAIILGGTYWRVSIYENYYPKKAKASLVELIGQLPMPGESFRCTADGNQMELPGEDLAEIVESMSWKEPYEKTKILLESQLGYIRPYQKNTDTIYLNEIFTQLLDGTVETGEDSEIVGPCIKDNNYCRVFFYSDTCILEAWTIKPKTEEESDPIYQELSKTMLELAHMELPK